MSASGIFGPKASHCLGWSRREDHRANRHHLLSWSLVRRGMGLDQKEIPIGFVLQWRTVLRMYMVTTDVHGDSHRFYLCTGGLLWVDIVTIDARISG